jgi:DNA-binding CsgD family transcriptional regulator
MDALNEASLRKRQALAEVRRRLRSGDLAVPDLLRDPPAVLEDRCTFEVLLLARRFTRKRLWALNERATRAGLNLAKPICLLTASERRWLAAALQLSDRDARIVTQYVRGQLLKTIAASEGTTESSVSGSLTRLRSRGQVGRRNRSSAGAQTTAA